MILVTGADGFIGSHLVERLKGDVRALVQYNSFDSLGHLNTDAEVVCGDIRDPFFCRDLLSGIDTVYNLSALIDVPYSYRAPHSYIETNVVGTLNLCRAARDVKKFVQVSSSEVYGTALYTPIDEKHPKQPQSPYSASKIGADAIALSHFYSYGLPVVVARPFNTFGPRQSQRAVIPSIIHKIRSGRLNLGLLTPRRDFNFVTDTCDGLIAAANFGAGEEVNIGSGVDFSIADAVNAIQQVMGTDLPIETDEVLIRPERSEVHRLLCDNTKICSTGWSPKVDFYSGIEITVESFL